jgi:hypothetical protein
VIDTVAAILASVVIAAPSAELTMGPVAVLQTSELGAAEGRFVPSFSAPGLELGFRFRPWSQGPWIGEGSWRRTLAIRIDEAAERVSYEAADLRFGVDRLPRLAFLGVGLALGFDQTRVSPRPTGTLGPQWFRVGGDARVRLFTHAVASSWLGLGGHALVGVRGLEPATAANLGPRIDARLDIRGRSAPWSVSAVVAYAEVGPFSQVTGQLVLRGRVSVAAESDGGPDAR